MSIDKPTYKVIKGAITKEYAQKVLKTVEELGAIESHPFDRFDGIILDYDKIDSENHLKNLLEYAFNYFKENYSIPGRDIVLTRSYGTIMHPGAMLGPHKDLYNSGRVHDFSYGDALVCNLYLSDFEGGNLYFDELGASLDLEAGDAVLFPGFLLNHGIEPVISGTRIAFLNHFSLLSEEDTKTGKTKK